MRDVIRLHPAAPDKPGVDQPCNGCGVCCASEPCPIGALASGRTTGACVALRWQADDRRYRCGMVARPEAHLPRALRWAAPVVARAALRYISAGSGCDCNVEVERRVALPTSASCAAPVTP